MSWMMYGLAALTVAAVILAIRERRKGVRMVFDDPADPTRDPRRSDFTKAEAIGTESQFSGPPHGGGIF